MAFAIKAAAASNQALLPLTLLEPNEPTAWGFVRRGRHRQVFEAQALAGLADSFKLQDSGLYQPDTPGMDGLIDVAKRNRASLIVCEQIHAPQEQQELQALQEAELKLHTIEQSALLPANHLPFEPQDTPPIFSEFRRAVEKAGSQPRQTLPVKRPLPPLPTSVAAAKPWDESIEVQSADHRSSFPYQDPHWRGDEASAQSHLSRYFASDKPRHYKQTRNGLTGTDYSTKFSPWLAVGSISAPQIWQALKDHEREHGANDSTYWIWFELLWRDHFRLMMQRFGKRLFMRSGLAHVPRVDRTWSTEGFECWRLGQTGHALIDAGMRELAATGYLSNRMRQIVASYLIHELQGDWLAGAAWFEHCLIDFDVHSNQGNWAYIAGVGTDPRGGRQFNPDKQARDHDPDGHYRQLWSTL